MTDRPTKPSGPLRAYAAVAKLALWLLFAAWLVVLLAWGALHVWIVPRIGEMRPRIEAEAGRALGVPVRIGAIEVLTEGFIPSFELRDVSLLDTAGQAALRLPRILVALSPRSVLNLGFEQLYIDRPELDIRRAADGRIFVAGLDLSRGGEGGGGNGAEWFFDQPEFVIRNGTVRWVDEMRGAPPLSLGRVDFVLRNGARRHAMRLDATPPAEWGDRFSVQAMFRQPLLSGGHGHWREWDGQVHGDFTRVDVSQLRRYASLGFEVSEGHGAMRAWADVSKGQLTGGVADVRLAGVNARLGTKLEPLALRSVSGRAGGKRVPGGFEFETRDLQFDTQEGQHWPGGNVFVRWVDVDGSRPARGEIRADNLDLQALGQVAARLPLPASTHQAIAAYAPQGLVETLQAQWTGPLDAPRTYQARTRASRLRIAAQPAAAASGARPAAAGTPGIEGAAVDLDFTQDGGKGKLQVKDGALELPGVFEDPLVRLDELTADLQWKIDRQAISASVAGLKFANADIQGEGQGSWRTGAGARRFPGFLDLQATFSRADGARVWRYLPLGVPREARNYVHESVTAGAASGGRIRVKGDLRDFPFRDPKRGEFRVTAEVRDATLAYVPPSRTRSGPAWPALTQVSGELVFERGGMQVKGATGRFAGSQNLQFKADAQIPNLEATVVGVTAGIKGPLPEALAIVNGSPISAIINRTLAGATATGPAEVKLKLDLPVGALDKSKVQGSVALAGNDLQITPDTPVLARARGTVAFSEKGFGITGGQARALGGDLRIEGGTRTAAGPRPETFVQIRAQGTATAEGLRQARELGFVSRLARDAAGTAPYSMTLTVRRGVPEIAVTSSLQGLAVNLPAPFSKAAEASLPLRYENVLTRDTLAAAPGSGRLQDQLSVEVGRLAAVNYVRDLSAGEPRVLRGTIAVGLSAGESVAMPDQGVASNINLGAVNIDTWSDLLSAAPPASAPATASRPAASAPAPAAAPAPGAPSGTLQSYLPNVMALRARELVVGGRTLHNVVIGGSRDGGTWRANAEGTEFSGYVEYRQAVPGATSRLYGRLARLSIAASAARDVESLLDEQPATLPALDVVVDDFDLKGKKLGKLEIDAVNRSNGPREGGAREWRLNKLNLTMPEAVFSATGNWAAVNAQAPASRAAPRQERMRTAMKFRLDIADSGQLLARFGMNNVVRRGKGRMEGQVAWIGSPIALNYATMDGSFNVNMEGGQFLKAEPGLAKLLGVVSLQALPRRLALDFRDVFSEGFAFDFVRGDITIQDGIAATNNLQMKGVNAAVLMEGKADIERETQELKVVVVPEINAGTASLVAGVINPAIGLGTFLAQMVLRQPLIRATTQEFQVDGTWADPRVTRVRRGLLGGPEAQADPGRTRGAN